MILGGGGRGGELELTLKKLAAYNITFAAVGCGVYQINEIRWALIFADVSINFESFESSFLVIFLLRFSVIFDKRIKKIMAFSMANAF